MVAMFLSLIGPPITLKDQNNITALKRIVRQMFDCIWLWFRLIQLITKFNMLKEHNGVQNGVCQGSWARIYYIHTTISAQTFYVLDRHNHVFFYWLTLNLLGSFNFFKFDIL